MYGCCCAPPAAPLAPADAPAAAACLQYRTVRAYYTVLCAGAGGWTASSVGTVGTPLLASCAARQKGATNTTAANCAGQSRQWGPHDPTGHQQDSKQKATIKGTATQRQGVCPGCARSLAAEHAHYCTVATALPANCSSQAWPWRSSLLPPSSTTKGSSRVWGMWAPPCIY